jgi:hypothetical protein
MKKAFRCFLVSLITCAGGVARADYYVAKSGQGPVAPYTSWTTAASNIQAAVNSAIEGATVWVAPGTYTLPPNPTNYMYSANVVYINKLLTLRSSNGVPESTVINGGGANRGIAVVRSVTSSKLFVLNGLTISNCVASTNGGGIVISATSWTGVVQNCVITRNKALGTSSSGIVVGGGIYAYVAAGSFGLTISNCVIRSNHATNTIANTAATYGSRGGAMYLYGGTGPKRILRCLIEDNVASSGGGGCMQSPVAIEHSTIRNNRCYNTLNINTGGGGLEFAGGDGWSLRNCLIYKNRSPSSGGAIYKFEPSVATYYITTMDSCTVVSNYAASGRMFHWRRNGGLTLNNSIVYGNDILWRAGAPKAFTNNWIYGQGITNGVHGTGNITNNVGPFFVNLGGDNFHLSLASPCINAGTILPWMASGFDLDGGRRIDGAVRKVDMGCYEYVYHGSTVTVR